MPEKAGELLTALVELAFLESSGREAGEEHFQFRHTTFLEFLAAKHVASSLNRDGWSPAEVDAWHPASGWQKVKAGHLLDAQAFEPAWEPIIVFIAGLMKEPLPLFEILADRKKDDLYRHRLGLLCRCFRALYASEQATMSRAMEPVFEEILRIAKRCEHDDAGHRKPWLDWIEILAQSPTAIERLCAGLLRLDGRYRGWTVSGKVQELLERVLVRGRVPASVVEAIARLGESAERQWGVNTLRLALSLAEDQQRRELVARFLDLVLRPDTDNSLKVRIAEALAIFGDDSSAVQGGELLISLAQSGSSESRAAIDALPELLQTKLAPVAAPILVDNLLNPSKASGTGNQYSPFWLAWKLIGKAKDEPRNPWSAMFLAIILFADREEDRLKLWAAQVLAQRSEHHLKELGLETLKELVQAKRSHAWVYAARWLVENGPSEVAAKARATLFAEAADHGSDHQHEATAELLNMGAISPIGEPIEDVVREAVLRELATHGQKYGSRLHVSAPGVPPGNIDQELFADNPAAVIRVLHTFRGPSPYFRERDDPNEEKRRERSWNALLLRGTRYWPDVLRCSIQSANEGVSTDLGALSIIVHAANGSDLLALLRKTMERMPVSSGARPELLEELYERGWRLRFRGRRIEVLRRGREEPRADFGF